MIPLVGFLPADDPRMVGTVAAIERFLVRDGFVHRYMHDEETRAVDGLPPGEGAFLPCTFWLADNLALQGRHERGPRRSSSGCSTSATTSAARGGVGPETRRGSSETSRRRSPTSRW